MAVVVGGIFSLSSWPTSTTTLLLLLLPQATNIAAPTQPTSQSERERREPDRPRRQDTLVSQVGFSRHPFSYPSAILRRVRTYGRGPRALCYRGTFLPASAITAPGGKRNVIESPDCLERAACFRRHLAEM